MSDSPGPAGMGDLDGMILPADGMRARRFRSARAVVALMLREMATTYGRSPGGYVWAPGYWEPRGQRHVWRAGHWVQARPGYVYRQPVWSQHGNRWDYRASRWDRDGDGVPNRHDRNPNNPYRR